MQAVVLVGGEGTRLRPLTHGTPKPMVPIFGVPFLERALSRLRESGITHAILAAGYMPEAITRHLGDGWIAMPEPGGELYLSRAKGAPWQIVAETHAGGEGRSWRAEYRDFENGLPRSIRLSADDRGRFDLALALSQLEINTTIDEAAFTVKVPASAAPMTLAELRDAVPLPVLAVAGTDFSLSPSNPAAASHHLYASLVLTPKSGSTSTT